MTTTTIGAAAKVNSDYHHAYHQHKLSTPKHVYVDPKMRIAMEMEAQEQSLLNQQNEEQAEMNRIKDARPHSYAQNVNGHFEYRLNN